MRDCGGGLKRLGSGNLCLRNVEFGFRGNDTYLGTVTGLSIMIMI